MYSLDTSLPNAGAYQVYVRGLSEGRQEIEPLDRPRSVVTKYKTLRIDFVRDGNVRNVNQKEIELNEPPYE